MTTVLERSAELVGLDPQTLGEVLDRASSADFDAWEWQVRKTGGCSHPVRLYGQIWENGRLVLDTETVPDRVLYTACGNRRASVCESCSLLYKMDMRRVLRAGLVGDDRENITPGIAGHPSAFVTLTAQSFGAVHGMRDDNAPCQRHAEGTFCRHGRPRWCRRRHTPEDGNLGQPICMDCYDYPGHVLFNWWAPELWRRFTIAVTRRLAHRLGMTAKALRKAVRVSFAKVAEFQRRAVVHFHAVMRLDARTDPGVFEPPPFTIPFEEFKAAVEEAAAHVTYRARESATRTVALAFGDQVLVKPINTGKAGELTSDAVANYCAKYATKAAEDHGIGTPEGQLTPHAARILAVGHNLAETVPELRRMAKWSGMLFFRGHFATKSRSYSLTLRRLRQVRAEFQRRAELDNRTIDGDDQADDDDTTLVINNLRFAGQGYTTTGEALLAAGIAARTRANRRNAREPLAMSTQP